MPTDPISKTENLFRGLRRFPKLWNESRNRPSTAAFKDKRGLSVDRCFYRPEENVIEHFYHVKDLQGLPRTDFKCLLKMSAGFCYEIGLHCKPSPSPLNEFHCELLNSNRPGDIEISDDSAYRLTNHVEMI